MRQFLLLLWLFFILFEMHLFINMTKFSTAGSNTNAKCNGHAKKLSKTVGAPGWDPSSSFAPPAGRRMRKWRHLGAPARTDNNRGHGTRSTPSLCPNHPAPSHGGSVIIAAGADFRRFPSQFFHKTRSSQLKYRAPHRVVQGLTYSITFSLAPKKAAPAPAFLAFCSLQTATTSTRPSLRPGSQRQRPCCGRPDVSHCFARACAIVTSASTTGPPRGSSVPTSPPSPPETANGR